MRSDHQTYLTDRGIGPEAATAAALKSVGKDECKSQIGPHEEGLWTPILSPTGKVHSPTSWAIRCIPAPEGKPDQRFQRPAGDIVHVHYPRSITPEQWADPTIPLVIVEGPFKAVALAQYGIAAIGLGGINTSHDTTKPKGTYELHPELTLTCVPGREVIIFFDAHFDRKSGVMGAAALLARMLLDRGCVVRVVAPPTKDDGPDQGPADDLASHGLDAVKSLIASARLADPIARIQACSTLEEIEGVLKDTYVSAFIARVNSEAYVSRFEDVLKAKKYKRPGHAVKACLRLIRDLWAAEAEAKAAENPEKKEEESDDRLTLTVRSGAQTDNVTAALAEVRRKERLHQRGGSIVRIDYGLEGTKIEPVEVSTLAGLIDRHVRFVMPTERGPKTIAGTPKIYAQEAKERGARAFPSLKGIVKHPIMTTKGLVTHGYSEEAGYYVDTHPSLHDGLVNEEYTKEEAQAAAERLLGLFAEFPFDDRELANAVMLTAVLEVFARPMINGPVPGMFITANKPKAGKGTLSEIIHAITVGLREDFTTAKIGLKDNDEDDVKVIMSFAQKAPEMIVCDNVMEGRTWGNSTVLTMMTSTVFSGRMLGGNKHAEYPITWTTWVNGNNIRIHGDGPRRFRAVSLVAPEEQEFKIGDIVGHVLDKRRDILRDALTILIAFSNAGRPRPEGAKAWDSYGSWSDNVRLPVLWLGYSDPLLSVEKLRQENDDTSETLSALHAAISAVHGERGISASEIVEMISGREPKDKELLNAIKSIFPSASSAAPKSISNALRKFQNRMLGGRVLRNRTRDGYTCWYVADTAGNQIESPAQRQEREDRETVSRMHLV